MDRGERPNKSGDSWFSPKTIEVVPREKAPGGRALFWLGGHGVLPNQGKLRIPGSVSTGDRAPGANVRTQKGNNPDRRLRSPITAKWKTKWKGRDNQEVGLEAAILQRKRNSSLVESFCAEDVTGLSC